MGLRDGSKKEHYTQVCEDCGNNWEYCGMQMCWLENAHTVERLAYSAGRDPWATVVTPEAKKEQPAAPTDDDLVVGAVIAAIGLVLLGAQLGAYLGQAG